MEPGKRQLQFARGARIAIQRLGEDEIVLTTAVGDRVQRFSLTKVEACGTAMLLQNACGDPLPFGGFGHLPVEAA